MAAALGIRKSSASWSASPPRKEEGQKKILEAFLSFFKKNKVSQPKWKKITAAAKKLPKKIAEKSFGAFGFKISRKKSTIANDSASYSNLDEQKVLNGYLGKLKNIKKYCVDIGASDGTRQSNTYALFKSGWPGLAIECKSTVFARLASAYQTFTEVNLCKNKITPENVIDILKANSVPRDFGFLNLDIDSYDYFVLEKILGPYHPSILCVEINESIPPPIKFAVNYTPDFKWSIDHFFGQSLSQLFSLASKNGYELIELHYNNAIFVAKEFNFTKQLSPEEAYKEGYLDRPDRKEKFPWNSTMEEVLHLPPAEALEFINKFFKKYKGKYTISL